MMYKVTMRCGHVGEGKFIPITYVVYASDKKQAEEKARRIPRVKHDDPKALIHIAECRKEEAALIMENNSKDPYLKSTYNNPIDLNIIKDRIRMMPEFKAIRTKENKRISNFWRNYIQEGIQYAY